jgi:hypothetical protein
MKYLVFLGVFLILGGCEAVETSQPIGEKPTSLEGHQAEWEGVWIAPDTAVTIKVTDAANGALAAAWIEESDGKLAASQAEVLLRDAGGFTFANLKAPDETDWLWARIVKKDRQIVLFVPALDQLSKLVTEGKLPGKVKDHVVTLEALSPAQLALLTSETGPMLYDWQEPLVLMKL